MKVVKEQQGHLIIAKLKVGELPFALTQSMPDTETVCVVMQDETMYVETTYGEPIEDFVPLLSIKYWFDTLPKECFFIPDEPRYKWTVIKELRDTSIPIPVTAKDTDIVRVTLNRRGLGVYTEYTSCRVWQPTEQMRIDFNNL